MLKRAASLSSGRNGVNVVLHVEMVSEQEHDCAEKPVLVQM